MAIVIQADNGREAYVQALAAVKVGGRPRNPRGRKTLDAGLVIIELVEPYGALPTGLGRDLNPAIGAAEALQLIAGVSNPGLMLRISPKFSEYTDEAALGIPETAYFHGAYGRRIGLQATEVVRKLTDDPSTRQAVITLWDPTEDNIRGKRDYPCTVMLQFEVNDGRLCMNTVMRSNDAWLGLPYDMFQFTQLQLTIARCLRREPGWYRHTALSLHIYEEDIDKASQVYWSESTGAGTIPSGIGSYESHDIYDAMKRARRILGGLALSSPTASERWYFDQLQRYRVGAA